MKDQDHTTLKDYASLENIKAAVEKRHLREAEDLPLKDNNNHQITSKFIRDCLAAYELGDGLMYAFLHIFRFRFNKDSREWHFFNGHHWERDIEDKALAAVEAVSRCYLEEAQRITQQITESDDHEQAKRLQKIQLKIYRRIYRLRTADGRKRVISFAHTNDEYPLHVRGYDLDQKPDLLACANGVINLLTGELQAGRPEDYLLKASPVEYKGIDAPAPIWEKTLSEIFQKNDSLIQYLGRLFGYAITGHTKEHILPVFYGQGRNGKGTVIEIIKDVLGDLAAPIPAELLLDQGRAASSSGPSPDIMALRGLRIAFGSESDENRRFSTSKVKWLTGGDTLVGRNPHDRYQTHFRPTHKLFLMTNNKPHAPVDDFAFWERVHLIPFNVSFVSRTPQRENELPADPDLFEKLKSETPGVLAWLIRGCLQWRERGLDPPTIVKEATLEYRRDEDILADFIDDCCYLDPDSQVGASDIYTKFRDWWEANVSKKGIPSQRRFGKWMVKRFKREKIGTYQYFGLGLTDEIF